MTTLGHKRLADGTLLRLDLEQGKYVGRHYDQSLHVLHRVIATTISEVTAEMENWA